MTQLSSSLNAALASGLRSRATAVAAQLDSGPLPGQDAGAAQSGNQPGQWPAPGADEFTQVLTPAAAVVYPAGAGATDPLLSPAQLHAAVMRGNLTLTTKIDGQPIRVLASGVLHGKFIT